MKAKILIGLVVLCFFVAFASAKADHFITGQNLTCSDNQTLTKTTWYHVYNFTTNSWDNETRSFDTHCENGCNYSANSCNQSKWFGYVFIMLLALLGAGFIKWYMS